MLTTREAPSGATMPTVQQHMEMASMGFRTLHDISAAMRGHEPRKGIGRVLETFGSTLTVLLILLALPALLLLAICDLATKPLFGLSLAKTMEAGIVWCVESVAGVFSRCYPLTPRKPYPCQTIRMVD